MIDKILIILLFVLIFVLGITLGAGAIEYERVEKEIQRQREEVRNGEEKE
ncbi:MAG: hypothetical protein OSJ67_00610 [Clostridia bacterium]|nr:hypothetical protein [Clostridia bacterium]